MPGKGEMLKKHSKDKHHRKENQLTDSKWKIGEAVVLKSDPSEYEGKNSAAKVCTLTWPT